MLRRAAAVLAGVALLHVLVAPAVSACERLGVDGSTMAANMDHAAMQDSGVSESRMHTASPALDRSTSSLDPVPSGCPDPESACNEDCAVMAGCTAVAFVA
ncbi:MAG TPA: hypothetical protein VF981_13590, partial [Gemmatimonadaceae bacterium]